MEQITIQTLWNAVDAYGFSVRRQKKISGLEAWNKIKSAIPVINIQWSETSKSIYEQLRRLGVTGDDDDEKNPSWEHHHFLIQHGRIVKNNEGSLLRLLQIAYNTGQYRAAKCEKDAQNHYTELMLETYIIGDFGNPCTYTDIRSIAIPSSGMKDLLDLLIC